MERNTGARPNPTVGPLEWPAIGGWAMLHQVLLHWSGDLDAVDWIRASGDNISVCAGTWRRTGPNPTDRGKAGNKYHFLMDRQSIPLAVRLTVAPVTIRSCWRCWSTRSNRSIEPSAARTEGGQKS